MCGINRNRFRRIILLVVLLTQHPSARQAVNPSRNSNQLEVVCYVAAERGGRFIRDFSAEDFTVSEDDIPQKIESLRPPGAVPYSILFLIDRGKNATDEELSRAKKLISSLAEAGRTKNEIGLAAYAGDLRTIRPYSSRLDMIDQDLARVPALGGKSIAGDAVDYAIRQMRDTARNARRVLVLLSSQFDKLGPATAEHVLAEQLQLHTVNIGEQELRKTLLFTDSLARDLREYSRRTGGRLWEAKTESQAEESGRKLAEFLDAQYALSYTSSNTSRKGRLRAVAIKAKSAGIELSYLQKYFEPRY